MEKTERQKQACKLASEYLGYLVDTEQLVERLVDKRMNEWMQLPKGDDRFMSSGEGSDIPAGKTVRMIACFQIETENIGDDTTLKLEFHSENSRLSAEAVVADIQKASNIDQMIQSE